MSKLTPWFPSNVKPVRRGVYERDVAPFFSSAGARFSYWSGKRWMYSSFNVEAAVSGLAKTESSSCQVARWRGLAKKP